MRVVISYRVIGEPATTNDNQKTLGRSTKWWKESDEDCNLGGHHEILQQRLGVANHQGSKTDRESPSRTRWEGKRNDVR